MGVSYNSNMPDISLLQQEYALPEEERRAPGLAALIAFIALLIILGGYLGLYFYDAVLAKRAAELDSSIAELKSNDVYKSVEQIKNVGTEIQSLKLLRENHSYPNKFIEKIAKSVHPKVYLTSGSINILQKSVSVVGVAPSSIIMARQIELYGQNEEIASFQIKNLAYGENRTMNFGAEIKFK